MKSNIYTYTKTNASGEQEEVTVTWDQERCIHAAACVNHLPDVFDPDRRPWIAPDEGEADAIEEAVCQCPTGALHLTRNGENPETAPPETRVTVFPNGPLLVHGDVDIVDSDGEVLVHDTRVALCRCGRSDNQPLCDGSHDDGFVDEGAVQANQLSGEGPSGAASESVHIQVAEGGPLLLQGPITLEAADGERCAGRRGALCRCGASGNKPFCDGSHNDAHRELHG